MRIPKNTSVPVQLDQHTATATPTNSRTPKNSTTLHSADSTKQLQQQLQQLQPVRTSYINQVGSH
jgi:hypothetical protein